MLKQNIYNVSFARCFLDALASKILEDIKDDYLALCDITIFLPNRRAIKSLTETFLRMANGKVMLLPKMLSLGDINEDDLVLLSAKEINLEPLIDDIERQLLLSLLVRKKFEQQGKNISYESALSLASELISLIDETIIYDADLSKVKQIVADEFAKHWQETIAFLSIITDNWDLILNERNQTQKASRQKILVDEQILNWQQNQPQNKIIMAGFANYQPTIAKMLKTVANLPNGQVIFYGLDNNLDDEAFAKINELHPQYGFKQFLSFLNVNRKDILELDFSDKEIKANGNTFNYTRVLLGSEIMRPSAATSSWSNITDINDEALLGLNVITFKDQREEALSIALMMRNVLENKGLTCALVTPNRSLARRVASELERWNIIVDDSAGKPLSKTPVGIFILLTAQMVLNDFNPKDFLATMKHPFACGGIRSNIFRSNVRRLELEILRGIAPKNGFLELINALDDVKNDELRLKLQKWLETIYSFAQNFIDLTQKPQADFKQMLKAHLEFLESLAATDIQSGAEHLWQNDDGETAASFIANLYDKADLLKTITPYDYLGILENLMAEQTVRAKYNLHPRLAVLGLLEARLQRYDLMIMGGLNEGVWPADPKIDSFMNQQMRKTIGLSPSDKIIGTMAYDFISHFCSPNVIITRSEKENGTLANCSRWLLRLDAVLEALELKAFFAKNLAKAQKWHQYSVLIDKPDTIKAIMPPAPCPPLNSRPRSLAVTGVETLMRDPYAVYAKHILRLKALDAINAEAGANEFGSRVHAIIAEFITQNQKNDDLETLLDIGKKYLFDEKIAASIQAFWWSNFVSIAQSFISAQESRQDNIKETFCEIKGSLSFDAPFAPFELYAIADRIDVLKDNSLEIIDYKTGSIPTKKDVLAGFSPQLPLEVVIAKNRGFKDIATTTVSNVIFWELKGRDKSKISSYAEVINQADEALTSFKAIISVFDDENTCYLARPHPSYAPKYSDYQHLARVKEWASGDNDEE